MVDKPKISFVIDALMFLCLTAMAGLGLLMKYVLVPGRVARVKYGRPVELTWLGWDRHDWGDIHFYLALVLAGLLVVHLILHWQMILGLYARLIPDLRWRQRVALAFLIAALLLLYFPFLATPKAEERGRGAGWRQRSEVKAHERLLATGFQEKPIYDDRGAPLDLPPGLEWPRRWG